MIALYIHKTTSASRLEVFAVECTHTRLNEIHVWVMDEKKGESALGEFLITRARARRVVVPRADNVDTLMYVTL